MQEGRGLVEGAACLGQKALGELPSMRHHGKHREFDRHTRGLRLLGEAQGIVAQDLADADMDQERRKPGKIRLDRRGARVGRVGPGEVGRNQPHQRLGAEHRVAPPIRAERGAAADQVGGR